MQPHTPHTPLLIRAALLGTALLLLSCTKTEVRQPYGDDAITFTNIGTKAPVESKDDIKSFSVWGWYADDVAGTNPSIVFDNTEVYEEDAAWTYDGLQFWQSGKTYDFYALYPDTATLTTPDQSGNKAAESASYDAAGTLTVTGFDSTSGHDLMTASNTGLSGTNPPQSVAFTFSHELALVSFYIQRGGLWEAEDDIKVSVELSPISLKGKMIHNAEASLSSWSELSASSLHESEIMLTAETPGEFIFNNTEEDALLMIPQNIESVVLSVTYSSLKQEEQIRSVSITSTTVLEWEAGKQYRYTMTVQPNAIVFDDLKADEWGETSSGGAIPVE